MIVTSLRGGQILKLEEEKKKKCLHIHEPYVAVLFVSPHQQSGYVISPVTVRVEEGETKKKKWTSFGKLKVVYR